MEAVSEKISFNGYYQYQITRSRPFEFMVEEEQLVKKLFYDKKNVILNLSDIELSGFGLAQNYWINGLTRKILGSATGKLLPDEYPKEALDKIVYFHSPEKLFDGKFQTGIKQIDTPYSHLGPYSSNPKNYKEYSEFKTYEFQLTGYFTSYKLRDEEDSKNALIDFIRGIKTYEMVTGLPEIPMIIKRNGIDLRVRFKSVT